MRLGGSYTHAWTRPDLAGLPIKSTTQIVSLFASYPVTLTQAHQLTVGGGLDVIDQDIGLGGIPLNRDRLRVLTLHADAGWIDAGSIAGRGGYSPAEPDRQSVGEGKRVSVRVALGGRRLLNKKQKNYSTMHKEN